MNCSLAVWLSPNSLRCCLVGPPGPLCSMRTLMGRRQVQLQTVGFHGKLQQQAHRPGLWRQSKGGVSSSDRNSLCRREFYEVPICKLPLVTHRLIHSSPSFISKCKGSLSIQLPSNTACFIPSLYLKLFHTEVFLRYKCLDPLWLLHHQ